MTKHKFGDRSKDSIGESVALDSERSLYILKCRILDRKKQGLHVGGLTGLRLALYEGIL